MLQSLLAAQAGMVSFPETQFFLLVPPALDQQGIAESVSDQLLARFSKHIQRSELAAGRLRALCRNGALFCRMLFERIGADQIVWRLKNELDIDLSTFPFNR